VTTPSTHSRDTQIKGMSDEEKAERSARNRVGSGGNFGSINKGETDRLFDVNHDEEEFNNKPVKKANMRGIAIIMACCAGLLFGTCFNPPQHVSDMSKSKFCSKVKGFGNDNDKVLCNDINRYCQSNLSEAFGGCDELSSFNGRMCV
jgi:hypothetical protein